MEIVITGAAGFLGARLAAVIAATEVARDAADREFHIGRIVLADSAFPASTQSTADTRIERIEGDVSAPAFVASLVTPDTRLVYHLAGVMSGASEADFGLGMRVNLDGTRNLIEACRGMALRDAPPVRLVFASSNAVYGHPLPMAIDDDTPTRPTLSHGMQKLVCELLLDEYTRRGFIDARALRLPGIVVRPPAPNGALPDINPGFSSDLLREPLAGRDYTCPVGPEATIWIQSAARCVKNLIHAAHLPSTFLGTRRALLLPAVAVSIGEIVDAIRRIAGDAAAARVSYQRDAVLQERYGAWPRRLSAARALQLGFEPDTGLTEIINGHLSRPKS